MQFFKVVALDRLSEGRGRVCRAGVVKVAVFMVDGEVKAIKNHCPHAGGSLGVGEVKGKIVYCPRHRWGFNVETGACVTQPMFEVATYPVELRDGWVWVGV